MKRRSLVPLCHACSQPLAASVERCPHCGHETVPVFLRELGERLARELAEELGESPYLRGSGGLSYTLRGHTWGFLEDSDHPLGRAILWTLFRLAVASEPSALPFVLHHAIYRCLRREDPRLARAVDYLRKRLAAPLAELCASEEARAFRKAEDAVNRSSPTTLDDELEADLGEWFESWRLSPAVSTRDAGSR